MDKHRVILPYPFFLCCPRQAHAMWQFHDYGHRKRKLYLTEEGDMEQRSRAHATLAFCAGHGPRPRWSRPGTYLQLGLRFYASTTAWLWISKQWICDGEICWSDNCNFLFVNFKTANCASVATEHCDGRKSSLISCTFGRVEAHAPGILIALKPSFKEHMAAIFELSRIWWEISVSDSLWWYRSLNAEDNTGQPTVVDAELAELLKDGCAWHFLMCDRLMMVLSHSMFCSLLPLWGHLSPMMME